MHDFKILFQGAHSLFMASNPFCHGIEHAIKEKIENELKDGKVALLDMVAKKAPGEYRLILNLSYLHGESMNVVWPDFHVICCQTSVRLCFISME